MKEHKNKFFVIGTDTGVGKTVLSLLFMQFFYTKGFVPFYIKLIQTGCINPYDKDSDAKFIYQHVKQLRKKDPSDSVIYCFRTPKAPYFASRNEEKTINIKIIQNYLNKMMHIYSPIIMEAAGGVLVPVNEEILMIDLINMTKAKPIIAARAGLGTINHTLLTIEALHKRNIQTAGIIFMDSGNKGTQKDIISENIEAVEHFSGIKVVGVIDKIKNFSSLKKQYHQHFEKILEKLIFC